MKYKKAYLNLSDGIGQEFQVEVKEELHGEVHAVFIDAFSNKNIDAEFGAAIELELAEIKNWMADYRHSEYWCRPAFGTGLTSVPEETQGLIYQKEDGLWGVILPAVSEQYKCVLEGIDQTTIRAKLFSWYETLTECKGLAFLWAEGKNPYEMLAECARVGLDILGTGYRTREERRYPEIFEYLGWCSWDAFEIRVNEKSLLEKCQEFQEKKIPVKWVILDDMWAEIRDFYGIEYADRQEMIRFMHDSKLYSFHADPKRFPNGLKHCIDTIKEYGLKVGMWHPTTGYWKGLDPKGDAYLECRDCLIKTEDGRYIHSPEREKAYRFYHTFHDYLRKCGAEFIKIDNQSMSRRFYKGLAPVGETARQFHDAMEASVGQHFDNQMINCMGMANEDMWNRSVSPIARCSDDFQPEDRAWFVKHILQCAYNCLIQGQFYYCDWDMWWTDDGQALKNSILRAISGGPVYISDTLNRSRAEVLQPLILEDGRILRCDRPAVPTIDCLTLDPTKSGRIFKLQNQCNDGGVIAVFNLNEKGQGAAGTISPSDVDGLTGEEFAVYEHFSGEFHVLKKEEMLEISLKEIDDYKLFVIVPLQNGAAMIGRTDKFISPKTVRYNIKGEAELIENGPYAIVRDKKIILKTGGKEDEDFTS